MLTLLGGVVGASAREATRGRTGPGRWAGTKGPQKPGEGFRRDPRQERLAEHVHRRNPGTPHTPSPGPKVGDPTPPQASVFLCPCSTWLVLGQCPGHTPLNTISR